MKLVQKMKMEILKRSQDLKSKFFLGLEFPYTNINKWKQVELFCTEIKIYLTTHLL